jgi:hypothetical protein
MRARNKPRGSGTSARTLLARARRDLLLHIKAYAGARGAAEWTNGYRAGRPDLEAEKYAREVEQWRIVERVEALMLGELHSYTRLVRASERTKK